MEKQVKTQTTGARSAFNRVLATGLLAAGSFSLVQAQDTNAKSTAAEIRYAGTMQDKLIFQVEYTNEAQDPFVVELKDGEGYVFYTDRFKDKKFRKFFAIDKAELNKTSISISVATKGNIQKEVFDVNSTTKTVDEISVVKL